MVWVVRVPGALRATRVLHRVVGVLHRVLKVLHRVLGVLHRVLGVRGGVNELPQGTLVRTARP